MLEVSMNLASMARLCHVKAINHDPGPIVPSKPNGMVHLGPALMATADSVVYLLYDAAGFPSVNTPKEKLLPVRPFVQDTSLIDVEGESSL
jgi:hypothetical protein